MKKSLSIIIITLLALVARAQDLYIGSFYVTTEEEEALYGDGGDKWVTRRTPMCDMLNFEQPDILGLQSVTDTQISYMKKQMTSHKVVGDILYKNTLELVTNGEVDEMPEGSTCSWAKFKKDDKEFYVFNFYFATSTSTTSASRIRNAVGEINTENLPCFVIGYLGVNETKTAYTRMAGKFYDCFTQAPVVSAEYGTVNNFDLAGNHENDRFDFIFVSKNISVKAYGQLQYAYFTASSSSYKRRLPSTHFPVMAKVTLP